ncbi:hypothetical protein HEP81_00204 [Streptomyces griseofuscus]|uniref:Uncharacterized protein n=1 Tax=Streptomyces griseofuscus TaxID=146922 RepID=A0A7H1PR61_9ACTN|nr:hypothetical protein HEP81_00204 [Streptomyces griseofuscus]
MAARAAGAAVEDDDSGPAGGVGAGGGEPAAVGQPARHADAGTAGGAGRPAGGAGGQRVSEPDRCGCRGRRRTASGNIGTAVDRQRVQRDVGRPEHRPGDVAAIGHSARRRRRTLPQPLTRLPPPPAPSRPNHRDELKRPTHGRPLHLRHLGDGDLLSGAQCQFLSLDRLPRGEQDVAQLPLGGSDAQWIVGVLGCAHGPVRGERRQVDTPCATQVRAEQAVQIGCRPQYSPSFNLIRASARRADGVLDVGHESGQRHGGLRESVPGGLPARPRRLNPVPQHGRPHRSTAAHGPVPEQSAAYRGLGRVHTRLRRGLLLRQQCGSRDAELLREGVQGSAATAP